MPANCPFCNPDAARILLESESGIALYDAFPVSNGHAIVVPRKHVGSVFDLTAEEQSALWRLAAEVRARLRSEFRPEGFNIAVNDGRAAGADDRPRPHSCYPQVRWRRCRPQGRNPVGHCREGEVLVRRW